MEALANIWVECIWKKNKLVYGDVVLFLRYHDLDFYLISNMNQYS